MRPASDPADRLAIARALREISLLLDVKGEKRFRAQAYERGAIALESLRGDLATLVREGTLQQAPGIGPALAAEITAMHRSGSSPLLEKLRRELPRGILELQRVPGLGTGRIATLQRELGIGTIAELREACQLGRVRHVRGFGPATERRLLDAISSLGEPQQVLLLHEALGEAEPLLEHLRGQPAVERAELAGSVRRGAETTDTIELVVASTDAPAVQDALARWPRTSRMVQARPPSWRGDLVSGAHLVVHLASPSSFVETWHRLTGSAGHVERVLARPQSPRPVRDEADLYLQRGLPYVAPELRENEGEIEAALAGRLPGDLVSLEDLQGFVHCHTTYSDGRATIEQMARAAEQRGASYITITDHSPAAFYAGGLSLDRLREQWDEIDRVQQRVQVRIMRGTESDILADGALDYPDDVLDQLDLVVASVHARHRLDRRRMTERIVRAMRHPLFKVWGHGLGRLIGRRPPFECDVEAILDAVAESRAAIEINGDPHRLDLEPRWLRTARERGIRFVISTDAHSTRELGNLRYGVLTARRGWVRRGEVLNTLGVERFQATVRPAAQGTS